MNRFWRSSLMVPVVLLTCALIGGLYGGRVRASTDDSDVQGALRDVTRVYSAIEDNYADPVNPDKALYNGAIPGMLRELDPHTNFFDKKAYELLREEQKGKYYGVGMQVEPRGGKTIVREPFVGSPAYKAGLRPGDIIVQVDDKPTDNLTTTEVADLLKGPKDTTVRILVKREGASKPIEFIITRAEIPRYSIEQAFEIKPGIGYIKIKAFNETTGRELREAMAKLNAPSLNGLILDLRDNPGGLLTEGVAVADTFLDKGQVIVSHKGRSSGEKILRAAHGNGGLEYPLVVLVNRYSASASEIVAGAIQDHDRGLVVGDTTFGKGMVQTVYPLSDNTGLALTTAYFYTPSGRLIQRKFNGLSLYDYYYLRQTSEPKDGKGNPIHREVRTTDTGRTVYGGGGITPDVKLEPPKLEGFLLTLAQKYAFFGFAQHYLAQHQTVPRDFQVTDAVLTDFLDYLKSQNIAFTDQDIQNNRDTITRRIKQELFVFAYGNIEGTRIALEADPFVLKAVELMPEAKALAATAHKVLAQQRSHGY